MSDEIEDALILLLVVGGSLAALGWIAWWVLGWYLGDIGEWVGV